MLGKVRLVSESVLVQLLSKKIPGSKNGGSSHIVKESKFPLSSAAGAFVHGIEDEFHEVPTLLMKQMVNVNSSMFVFMTFGSCF